MNRSLLALCLLIASAASAGNTFGGPLRIGYAGCATKPTGAPYPDGKYDLQIGLYDAASGGTELKHYSLSPSGASTPSFKGGCFAVELDLSSLPSSVLDAPLFLDITIDVDQFPRIPLDAVPYALWAGAVHWADIRERPNLVNTLSAGPGISLPDGGVGDVVVAVDFAQVQRLLSPDGTCAGPNFVKSVNPATGVVSCAFPGAPTVTVGAGLLVGSDGGLNGGAASFSVTGGDLTFGLNLSTAGASTTMFTIPASAGVVDGGTILLTVGNGTSSVVARADHRHSVHLWVSPTQFEVNDSSEGSYSFAGAVSKCTVNTVNASFSTVLLGAADSAAVFVPMPADFVPSRVVARIYGGCPTSSYCPPAGSPQNCASPYVTPELRFTAVQSPAMFVSTYGSSTAYWQPVPLANFLNGTGKVSIVQFTPVRVQTSYTAPPAPAQLNDMLFLQIRNTQYVSNLSQSYGWEIDGIELEFVP